MLLIKPSTQEYPYTFQQLKEDYPNVSFPSDLSGVEGFDVAIVTVDPEPEYNPETHRIISSNPVLRDGNWVIQWDVVPLQTESLPDWDGFNAAILSDTAFNQSTGAVFAQAPSVAIALPSALAQVSTNGVSAFSLVFTNFCLIGQVSAEQRDTWATMAETYNLPSEFVAVVRGA